MGTFEDSIADLIYRSAEMVSLCTEDVQAVEGIGYVKLFGAQLQRFRRDITEGGDFEIL